MSSINFDLNEITKFKLDEINKMKEYFNNETKERKDIKKLANISLLLIMLIKFSSHYPRHLAR